MPDGGGPGGGTGGGERGTTFGDRPTQITRVNYIPQAPFMESSDDMLQQMMAMMMPFFQQMMGMTQSMMSMAQPAIPPMPEIEMPEPIDFKEAEAELLRRMSGQQMVTDAQKYSVADTLHASLLLDEPETTNDNLAGGVLV